MPHILDVRPNNDSPLFDALRGYWVWSDVFIRMMEEVAAAPVPRQKRKSGPLSDYPVPPEASRFLSVYYDWKDRYKIAYELAGADPASTDDMRLPSVERWSVRLRAVIAQSAWPFFFRGDHDEGKELMQFLTARSRNSTTHDRFSRCLFDIERFLFEMSATTSADSAGSFSSNNEHMPLQWNDPMSGQSYVFTRAALCDLWQAIKKHNRRLTYQELPEVVEHWKDQSPEPSTIDKLIADLKRFWKQQGRPDIANKIKQKKGTIGFG